MSSGDADRRLGDAEPRRLFARAGEIFHYQAQAEVTSVARRSSPVHPRPGGPKNGRWMVAETRNVLRVDCLESTDTVCDTGNAFGRDETTNLGGFRAIIL